MLHEETKDVWDVSRECRVCLYSECDTLRVSLPSFEIQNLFRKEMFPLWCLVFGNPRGWIVYVPYGLCGLFGRSRPRSTPKCIIIFLPRYLSIAHDARGFNLTYVVPLPTIRRTHPPPWTANTLKNVIPRKAVLLFVEVATVLTFEPDIIIFKSFPK